MSTYQKITHRAVIYSRHIEYYVYEKPIYKGFPVMRSFRRFSVVRPSVRRDNVSRARCHLRRLAIANEDILCSNWLLTYNFKQFDLFAAARDFHLFIKRVRRIKPDFSYIAVPEFQPRSGRIHYHMLVNVQWVDNFILEVLWGHGFTFPRRLTSPEDMSKYISPYLSKQGGDIRFFGNRKFLYSRNLKKPLIVDNPDLSQYDLDFYYSCECAFTFLTPWLGTVYYLKYKQYSIIKGRDIDPDNTLFYLRV